MPEVQGKNATTQEWYISNALDKLKLRYIFQYELFGGRNIRGGVIIDWLVFNPMGEPWEYFGEHWHTGALGADDRLRLAIVENYFGKRVKVIFGDEAATQEDATRAVRREARSA